MLLLSGIDGSHGMPPDQKDILVWKYLSLAKYLALLSTSALYFAHPRTFEDPFETYGALESFRAHSTNTYMTPAMIRALFPKDDWETEAKRRGLKLSDVEYLAPYRDLERDDIDRAEQLSEHLQKWEPKHLVSCWHESVIESDAMWRVYAGRAKEDAGLAVVSTLGRLETAIYNANPKSKRNGRTYEFVDAHRVQYRELIDDWNNDTTPLLVKRPPFAYEHEIRLLIAANQQEMRLVPLDLREAVDRVIVSPFAEAWQVAAITDVSRRYKLKDGCVTQSPLYRTSIR